MRMPFVAHSVARRLFSSCNSSSPIHRAPVHLRSSLDQGCIDYAHGWAWQYLLLNRRLVDRRQRQHDANEDNAPDEVLFLEHLPVYTLGRGSNENHLTFLQDEEDERCQHARHSLSRKTRGPGSARLAVDSTRWFEAEVLTQKSDDDAIEILSNLATPVICPNGVPVYRVERGGEVTFHGPGQLVVYPLLDLQREPFRKDLHWFLRQVEEVVILTLKEYGIESGRDEINTGVWVGKEKIAAVGISSARWISNHGFAINVSPDLSFFDTSNIIPCGIEGRGVTSIRKVLKERECSRDSPTVQDVSAVVKRCLEEVFNIKIENSSGLTVSE